MSNPQVCSNTIVNPCHANSERLCLPAVLLHRLVVSWRLLMSLDVSATGVRTVPCTCWPVALSSGHLTHCCSLCVWHLVQEETMSRQAISSTTVSTTSRSRLLPTTHTPESCCFGSMT